MKNILITGANGFMGRNLSHTLRTLRPDDVLYRIDVQSTQAELEQAIADLQDQIDDLEMSIMDLDAEEPGFPDSLLYSEWEDRKAELEAEMDDLEAEMDDFESQMDDVVNELDRLRR